MMPFIINFCSGLRLFHDNLNEVEPRWSIAAAGGILGAVF